MRRTFFVAGFSCLLALLTPPLRAQQQYVIGILPVYDQSAEQLTEFLPNGLAILLFKHLRASPTLRPVLLSAGGLYDPNSTDWNLEFGKKSHVDALLLTRLYKTTRVNDRKRRLKYTFQLMDTATGKLGPEITNEEVEVISASLLDSFEKSSADTSVGGYIAKQSSTSAGSFISSQSSGFWRSSEDFEKQPVGKAAARLADWTIEKLPTALLAQSTQQTGSALAASTIPSCKLGFKVRFVVKHTIAKGYNVFINDFDETSTITDGIASFPMPSGQVAVRVQIPDPPYGVPTQKIYQSSTVVLCDGSLHTLNFDIGSAGEALLHWE